MLLLSVIKLDTLSNKVPIIEEREGKRRQEENNKHNIEHMHAYNPHLIISYMLQ